MLAILTSLRAKALANDWAYHTWLLDKALDSITAQRNRDFMVYVGCHDIPDSKHRRNAKVEFQSVDFAPPQRTNVEMCIDKVLKLSAGVEWAKSKGSRYVMFTDADDLISNRISELASREPTQAGWFCPGHFLYTYGSHLVEKCVYPPFQSGPYVLVRTELLNSDAPPFSGKWADMILRVDAPYVNRLAARARPVNTLAAVGHIDYQALMAAEGKPLIEMPFWSTTMIQHGDSTSSISGGRGSSLQSNTPRTLRSILGSYKRATVKLTRSKFITPAFRAEFYVPKPRDIPIAYR